MEGENDYLLDVIEVMELFMDLDLPWLLGYALEEVPLPPDLADIETESLFQVDEVELLDAMEQTSPFRANAESPREMAPPSVSEVLPIQGDRRVAIWRPYRWNSSSPIEAIALSPIMVGEGFVLWEIQNIRFISNVA